MCDWLQGPHETSRDIEVGILLPRGKNHACAGVGMALVALARTDGSSVVVVEEYDLTSHRIRVCGQQRVQVRISLAAQGELERFEGIQFPSGRQAEVYTAPIGAGKCNQC